MSKTKSQNKVVEIRILKTILWTYIILCLVIAGLNYGYAPSATPEVAALIDQFWHFYENWIKMIFIIVGSFLTLRIIGKSERTRMRKCNLTGLIIAALVVHIGAPFLLHNQEVYFFTMPLPWTTTPIQLLYSNSPFYISRLPVWGLGGISAVLIFYVVFSLIVVAGTLLWGRRWQCSTICLFNGFAAEVFAPAMPLIGGKKTVKPNGLKIFSVLRWVFLALGVGFTLWWILFLSGVPVFSNPLMIGNLETYKYLAAELMMAMFFWVAFLGRGYCYYCPLGTVLGLLSKLAGQQISTNNSKCIQCNRCNQTCPMTIDIKKMATTGQAVKSLNCVGCGRCVDTCPTETLSYTTHFMKACGSKKS